MTPPPTLGDTRRVRGRPTYHGTPHRPLLTEEFVIPQAARDTAVRADEMSD